MPLECANLQNLQSMRLCRVDRRLYYPAVLPTMLVKCISLSVNLRLDLKKELLQGQCEARE